MFEKMLDDQSFKRECAIRNQEICDMLLNIASSPIVDSLRIVFPASDLRAAVKQLGWYVCEVSLDTNTNYVISKLCDSYGRATGVYARESRDNYERTDRSPIAPYLPTPDKTDYYRSLLLTWQTNGGVYWVHDPEPELLEAARQIGWVESERYAESALIASSAFYTASGSHTGVYLNHPVEYQPKFHLHHIATGVCCAAEAN